MRQRLLITFLCVGFIGIAQARCTGHFVNPLNDICWSCLLPLSIGDVTVASSDVPDTPNPEHVIETCPIQNLARIGLNIGYWEPFAMVDVTPTPYCFVNLGGVKLPFGRHHQGGISESMDSSRRGAFYQVHWYKYPLIYVLQVLASSACFQVSEFDIAYLSELDPTWSDDELDFIMNPESATVAKPNTQLACIGDSLSAMKGLPIDKLFWCAGAQGSMYPTTGTVAWNKSPLETTLLLAERVAFKLHRIALILDSSPDAGTGVGGDICREHYKPILLKSRYRYQLTNPSAAADQCAPFGRATLSLEPFHLSPSDTGDRGYLIWRKRNCTFL